MHDIHGEAKLFFLVPENFLSLEMHIFHLTVVVWMQNRHFVLWKLPQYALLCVEINSNLSLVELWAAFPSVVSNFDQTWLISSDRN